MCCNVHYCTLYNTNCEIQLICSNSLLKVTQASPTSMSISMTMSTNPFTIIRHWHCHWHWWHCYCHRLDIDSVVAKSPEASQDTMSCEFLNSQDMTIFTGPASAKLKIIKIS